MPLWKISSSCKVLSHQMPSNAAKSAGQAEGSSCQSVVSVPRSLVKKGDRDRTAAR